MPFLLRYESRDTRHIDFLRDDGLSTDTPDLGRHRQLLTLHAIADSSGAGSNMEHLDFGISTSSTNWSSLQRLERLVWGEHSLPHFLFSFFLLYIILFYFILISLIFLPRFSLIFS